MQRLGWANRLGVILAVILSLSLWAPLAFTAPAGANGSPGEVWAWGNNDWGQLGDGTTTHHYIPASVSGLTGVIAVAGGQFHSLALKADGTVWAWGGNWAGVLGDGTTIDRYTPGQVSGLSGVTAIANGQGYHSLALKADGTVWAWGFNGFGQLGDGTTTHQLTPVRVSGLTDVVAIASGSYHSLALKSDGTVWAWGGNDFGQLGDGTTTRSHTPVQVRDLTGVIAVAGGNLHSLALKSDGTVWAWGYNGFGQLGDGTTIHRYTPVQVSPLADVVAIEGGWDHSLALKSDGTVWAWGYNLQGQLGRGTSTNYETTPIQVSDLTDVIAMAASGNSLALKSDGTVWAWGSNFNGAIGDGTTTHRYTPVQVRDLTGVTAIAAGQAHRLAVKASRATPTITWNNPADMVYDTPLGPAQLNAVATHQRERVDGTYTYDPPAGTVLRPGTGRELRVVFTPADTRKYTSATASARVNVRYVFGGFRQPVLAPVQTFRLGSTVPVKVQIFGANGAVPDAVVHLDVYKLNDDGSYDPAKDLVPDGSGDLFRYDAAEQQHIYNFGTREIASSGPGQYALVAELDDGTFHTVRVHLR